LLVNQQTLNRLISELPEDLWYVIPENTDSNFAWQLGHLMMSQNFHTLAVITGRNKKVLQLLTPESYGMYNKIFNGMGSLHRSIEKDLIPTTTLKQQFDTVHEICIENLSQLTEDILEQSLEPIPFKHPMANSKYEALSWSFKHEMWHSAEMEEIKRMLGHPIKWLRE
jgi:hypothetical protein